MRRIGDAESDKYPACMHTIETHWHTISYEERNAWRTTLIKDLKDTLQHTDTQPDLSLILIQGICGAIIGPTYQMSEENQEICFKHLVRKQNRIGWHHILKGRLSHQWVQCQQLHIHSDPGTDSTKQSGEIWLKRVLNRLWTSLWDVWLLSNDDLHGRDRQQREQKRLEKLTPKVEALYDQATTLLTADKEIFAIPIHTRLTFPSREIETWIKLVTPTVRRALKMPMNSYGE
jgi:hypothetical protein